AAVTLSRPRHADCGRTRRTGKNVCVTRGCRFRDQGGVSIGDDALIGHNLVVATLNHPVDPSRRADLVPAPVTIGRNVWIGANVTILPGVTIGEDAVAAATSLVTRDVPAGMLVMGSPARVVRPVTEEG